MTDEPDLSATPEPPAGDAQAERTVEAVEAEYRARISGKDRAHAAEKAALEARIAELTAAQQSKDGQMTDDLTQLRSDNERLQREAAEAKEREGAAALAARKARFPNAAESLGDDLVRTVDEDKLADLETRLSGGAPSGSPTMLSDSARRPGGEPAKATSEKSIEELEADLIRYAPGSGQRFVDRQ